MPYDSKEVEVKGRALLRAASANEPSSTLLSLLDDLRRNFTASEEVLRSTRIGITVNTLRKHRDGDVGRQATELVSKWRSDIKKSQGATPAASATGSPKPVANGLGKAAGGSPAPEKKKTKSLVSKEKRCAKEDKVNTAVTGNPTRDNCVRLMYDGLAFMSEECEL
jgi:transcription elongation factor S-II